MCHSHSLLPNSDYGKSVCHGDNSTSKKRVSQWHFQYDLVVKELELVKEICRD